MVVAILALLLTILAPSLERAKEAARRAVCASNLHGAGQAVFVYSGSNSGRIPPFHNGEPTGADGWFNSQAWWSFVVKEDLTHAGSGPEAAMFNWRTLHAQDYLSDPRVLYCPSQRFEYVMYQTFTEFWADPVGWTAENTYRVRTNYHYNPNQPGVDRPEAVTEFQSGQALAVEVLHWPEAAAHADVAGWTVLYPDGAVRLLQSEWVLQYVQDNPKVANNWGTFSFIREELLRR